MRPPHRQPDPRDWSLKASRIAFIIQFFTIMFLLWINEQERRSIDQLAIACRAAIAAAR